MQVGGERREGGRVGGREREGGREGEGEREREGERKCFQYLDPFEDQFEKSAEKRRETMAKNEFKRLKNIKTAQKAGKVKGIL